MPISLRLTVVFSLWVLKSVMGQVSIEEQTLLIGEKYFLIADFENALTQFKKAENQTLTSKNWSLHIQSLYQQSSVLLSHFKMQEAHSKVSDAMRIAQEKLHETDGNFINLLCKKAHYYFENTNYEKALPLYSQALALTEKIDTTSIAIQKVKFEAHLGMGRLYFEKLHYNKAFHHLSEAEHISEAFKGDDIYYFATAHLHLAHLHQRKGSYQLAKENFDLALENFKKIVDESHPSIGDVFVGIAENVKSKGELLKAEQYYQQAKIIYEKYFDPQTHPKFGAISLGLGDLQKNQGFYEKALHYYQEALDLYLNTIGEKNQKTIKAYLGIANTFIYQEKFREALAYYGKIQDINFDLADDINENTAATFNNLGSLYYYAGKYEIAENYMLKALEIDKKILGAKHPNIANAYYNLARVQGEMGNTKNALNYTQNAISASFSDFNNLDFFVNPVLVNFFDNRDLLGFLSYKGQLLKEGFTISENVKGLDLAILSFAQSDSLVDEIRRTYSNRQEEKELAKLAKSIYESAVDGCYETLQIINTENITQLGENVSYEKKKREYENGMMHFMEKKKASILFSSIAESNAKSFGNVPKSLLQKDKDLKKIINRYTKELAYLEQGEKMKALQDSLFKANREYENLVAEMETKYPRYYQLKYDLGVASLRELQDFVDEETAILSYFLTDENMYVAEITKKGIRIFKNPLLPQLEENIKAFRNAIIYESKKPFVKYANTLYEQFFPFTLSENIKKLIIVPDGQMATIPFEALLPQFQDTAQTSWSDLPYLINRYAISYTYSANLLYKIFNNTYTQSPKAQKDIFLMAPVEFTEPYLKTLSDFKEKSYEDEGVPLKLRKTLAMVTHDLRPLLGSEEEINAIENYFVKRKKITSSYRYKEASEKAIKTKNVEDYQYVHIASHGFVNQNEPEFSGILLSIDTTSHEDGILFTSEMYGLTLNAELVSMSACETGLGEIKTGEGIIGITRALLYAGAKNINVSLWKVQDESTSEMMKNLYQLIATEKIPEDNMESINYAPMLREAKLHLIKNDTYASPVHWASFILIGK